MLGYCYALDHTLACQNRAGLFSGRRGVGCAYAALRADSWCLSRALFSYLDGGLGYAINFRHCLLDVSEILQHTPAWRRAFGVGRVRPAEWRLTCAHHRRAAGGVVA